MREFGFSLNCGGSALVDHVFAEEAMVLSLSSFVMLKERSGIIFLGNATKETYPYPVSCKKRSTLQNGITMTDGNKIAILQLNLIGISVANQILLIKYFNDLKLDFVALNET